MSELKYSAKIRGIYSTFLTKFLSTYFEITQATDVIKSRIELAYQEKEPDIFISNAPEIQKIYVSGKKEALEEFTRVLRKEIPDCIINTSQSGENAIYKGIVIKNNYDKRFSIVNFGSFKGILENEAIQPRRSILAKIEKPDFGRKKAIVSTNITLPGLYSVLLFRNRNKISQRIRDPQIRNTLFQLSNDLQIKEWGILWRTSSEEILYEDENILIEEVDRLQEKAKLILKRFRENSDYGLVLEGKNILSVEFPSHCKPFMDEVRRSVSSINTVQNHHYYKSINREFNALIDFAEGLIQENPSYEDSVNTALGNYFQKMLPSINQLINIHHVKVDGRTFYLSPGVLFEKKEGLFRVRRKIKGRIKSTYNGLNVSKDPGDYAILTCEFGKWFMRTEYFSSKNTLKGEYWNINTPIEFYFENFRIRYCDLEIDLIRSAEGEIEIVDDEKLEFAHKLNFISEELKNKAIDIVNDIKEKLSNNVQIFE